MSGRFVDVRRRVVEVVPTEPFLRDAQECGFLPADLDLFREYIALYPGVGDDIRNKRGARGWRKIVWPIRNLAGNTSLEIYYDFRSDESPIYLLSVKEIPSSGTTKDIFASLSEALAKFVRLVVVW